MMTPDELGARWRILKPFVAAVLGIALGIAVHWTCTQK